MPTLDDILGGKALSPNSPISLTASITINQANEVFYNGRMLSATTALTVTLAPGISPGFWFIGQPPSSGNFSIASSGGVLLNGATGTLTRALSSNAMFGLVNTALDSYAVNGS